MRPHPRPRLIAQNHTGFEGLDAQRRNINGPRQFRICGVQHLEAAIAAESVDDVGADSAADRVRGIPDSDSEATLVQDGGASQTRKSGTDDKDVTVCTWVPLLGRHRAVIPGKRRATPGETGHVTDR